MFGMGYLSRVLSSFGRQKEDLASLTVGKVVDTNDPQQMGRVRVYCPAFGDVNYTTKLRDVPFAIQVSPLAGLMTFGTRGHEDSPIDGPVAYGMFNTPKIGAYVLVGCIDGDKRKRFYVGGIHPQYFTHTLPHGRFLWNDETDGTPAGPADTFEQPIQPTFDNLKKQFTKTSSTVPDVPDDPHKNMEWRSRGADMQASAINNLQTQNPQDGPGNALADHDPGTVIEILQEDGTTREVLGPGYSRSQIEPNENFSDTGGVNYDSHNYSWTTPGFHSIAMNDRADNCRVRIRTTAGHQILMDDTNERIYINTAGGESWIEIDQVGNIDIYASKNISTHAGGDINFTSDKTFRVTAKEGIHMRTDGETRLHANEDIHVRSEQNIRTHSKLSTFVQSDERIHIRSTQTIYLFSETHNIDVKAAQCTFIQSGNELHIETQNDVFLESVTGTTNIWSLEENRFESSTGTTHIRAGNNIQETSGNHIHMNSGSAPAAAANQADPATEASNAGEKQSYLSSRVPEHEPWPRVFMDPGFTDKDGGNQFEPEYEYTNQLVGKGSEKRGDTYTRNPKWNR